VPNFSSSAPNMECSATMRTRRLVSLEAKDLGDGSFHTQILRRFALRMTRTASESPRRGWRARRAATLGMEAHERTSLPSLARLLTGRCYTPFTRQRDSEAHRRPASTDIVAPPPSDGLTKEDYMPDKDHCSRRATVRREAARPGDSAILRRITARAITRDRIRTKRSARCTRRGCVAEMWATSTA